MPSKILLADVILSICDTVYAEAGTLAISGS
jgi:hypothetical protein